MSAESQLQVMQRKDQSLLVRSPARASLITRGRKDADVLISVRTIELEDSVEEGHLGFKLQWKGTRLYFLAGTREIPIEVEDAKKLAAFLVQGSADLVWESAVDISVGEDWSFQAAREISQEYPQARERDVPRRRVRVHCRDYRWHLLPYELNRLGVLFREALV